MYIMYINLYKTLVKNMFSKCINIVNNGKDNDDKDYTAAVSDTAKSGQIRCDYLIFENSLFLYNNKWLV